MLSKIDLDDFLTNDNNPDLNRLAVKLMQDYEFRAITEEWSVTQDALNEAIQYCQNKANR